jgi:hypothetical protein
MAAATAMAIAGGLAAATQAVVGGIQKKKAVAAAAEATAKTDALIDKGMVNQLEGLQAPTQAFDLRDQKTASVAAGLTEAAADAGAEGVIGGASTILRETNAAGLETDVLREGAKFGVDKMVAEEEARLAGIKYEGQVGSSNAVRDGAQIAAQEAQGNISAGLGGVAGSFGNIFAGIESDKKTKPQEV